MVQRSRNPFWLIAPIFTGIVLNACGSQTHASDVITSKDADSVASAYAVRRLMHIEADDEAALRKSESPPAQEMDLQLAKTALVTKPPTSTLTVKRAESYVPHRSTYPASFISIVTFTDGSRSVMGFTRATDRDGWLLTVFADLDSAANIVLAMGDDGFAKSAPSPSQLYRFDPSDLVAFYLNAECGATSGCFTRVKGYPATLPPRDSVVSGELLDSDIAAVKQLTQNYLQQGFQIEYTASTLAAPKFPALQLASGGSLQFAAISEKLGIYAAGSTQRCFNVVAGQVDPLVQPGIYRDLIVDNEALIALDVPSHEGAGLVKAVGLTRYIAGHETNSTNC